MSDGVNSSTEIKHYTLDFIDSNMIEEYANLTKWGESVDVEYKFKIYDSDRCDSRYGDWCSQFAYMLVGYKIDPFCAMRISEYDGLVSSRQDAKDATECIQRLACVYRTLTGQSISYQIVLDTAKFCNKGYKIGIKNGSKYSSYYMPIDLDEMLINIFKNPDHRVKIQVNTHVYLGYDRREDKFKIYIYPAMWLSSSSCDDHPIYAHPPDIIHHIRDHMENISPIREYFKSKFDVLLDMSIDPRYREDHPVPYHKYHYTRTIIPGAR